MLNVSEISLKETSKGRHNEESLNFMTDDGIVMRKSNMKRYFHYKKMCILCIYKICKRRLKREKNIYIQRAVYYIYDC